MVYTSSSSSSSSGASDSEVSDVDASDEPVVGSIPETIVQPYVRRQNIMKIKKLTIQEFPGLSLFRSFCRLPELVPFLLTNCCTLFIA